MHTLTLYAERNNGDLDDDSAPGLGSFHKTLQHQASGDVTPGPFAQLRAASRSVAGDYGAVERSPSLGDKTIAAFVNPLAGRSRESLGPDPMVMTMPPAPKVASLDTAAEMVELYEMALLRDLPFDQWTPAQAGVSTAIANVGAAYAAALAVPPDAPPGGAAAHGALIDDDGRLKLGRDLPDAGASLAINVQTLFRGGLPGEDKGPLLSQFMLHDAPFGTQLIEQTQFAYAADRNYLNTMQSWLHAQNYGRSLRTRLDYPNANDIHDNTAFENPRLRKRIRTMRDLARFVHKDALHQAYFNAALLLLHWKAPLDLGNPYADGMFATRQAGFGTLGAPHLLTLVSEVASRALKVVWRQKWSVHLRLRPEAYGGVLHREWLAGAGPGQHLLPHFKTMGLTNLLGNIAALNQATSAEDGTSSDKNTVLLPMAFESGSPVHPAYGAGHATVAGACVTVLKAWFDESEELTTLFARQRPTHPSRYNEPTVLLQPGHDFSPAPLAPAQASGMTIGGELNKLAANVAMGRSMGGVHWRSDNTRSLRLGEQIATIILRRQSRDYAETGARMSYCSFDGHGVTIHPNGAVGVIGDPALERFYNQPAFAPLH